MFLAWWATLCIVLMFLPLGIMSLASFSIISLGYSLLLGLIPTALAFWLYNVGVKNDKGGNIIIIAYLEPVMASILDLFLFNRLSIFTILGGSLILVANIFVLKFAKNQVK